MFSSFLNLWQKAAITHADPNSSPYFCLDCMYVMFVSQLCQELPQSLFFFLFSVKQLVGIDSNYTQIIAIFLSELILFAKVRMARLDSLHH